MLLLRQILSRLQNSLHRLQYNFGVDGLALGWIRSYLENRSHFIKLQNETTSITNCVYGVPQGSVLGPLLFVVYVAPIASVAHKYNVNHHRYVDDRQMYVSTGETDTDVNTAKLQDCLIAVHSWFTNNGLVVNPDKSEAILFSTRQRAWIYFNLHDRR